MATMLRLLKPVESSWMDLAHILLEKTKLQWKVDTIEADCGFKDFSHKVLNDVFNKWLRSTKQSQRTWQTVHNAAKLHGDESLERYMQANKLKSKFQYVTELMKISVLIVKL